MDPSVVDEFKKIMEPIYETMIQAREELMDFCPKHCAEMNDKDAQDVHNVVCKGYNLLDNYRGYIARDVDEVLSWYK
jgi:hypothetical protein